MNLFYPIKSDVFGDAVFAETVAGLSSALAQLGVANKIVTHVETDCEALYIITFASVEVRLYLSFACSL